MLVFSFHCLPDFFLRKPCPVCSEKKRCCLCRNTPLGSLCQQILLRAPLYNTLIKKSTPFFILIFSGCCCTISVNYFDISGGVIMVPFQFSDEAKLDVIVTFDTESRSDDAYALTYALLSYRLNVLGIFATRYNQPDSVASSHREAEHIKALLGRDIPVYDGYADYFQEEGDLPPLSPAAAFLVDCASRKPVTILCMTVLTDIAMAIRACPSIASNLRIIWAGGGAYPKGAQYEPNIINDREAANFVLQSGTDFYQIPKNIYRMFNVSFSELFLKVKPYGELGEYLYNMIIDRAMDPKHPLRTGCYWVLGNLSIIGAVLCDWTFCLEERPAPSFTRHCVYTDVGTHYKINVFKDIDTRFILEDFFAKLQIFNM